MKLEMKTEEKKKRRNHNEKMAYFAGDLVKWLRFHVSLLLPHKENKTKTKKAAN